MICPPSAMMVGCWLATGRAQEVEAFFCPLTISNVRRAVWALAPSCMNKYNSFPLLTRSSVASPLSLSHRNILLIYRFTFLYKNDRRLCSLQHVRTRAVLTLFFRSTLPVSSIFFNNFFMVFTFQSNSGWSLTIFTGPYPYFSLRYLTIILSSYVIPIIKNDL